ncbi:aspartate--tRNA ligase [Candidatus Margulisiibacteriota bacterium]
MNWKNRVFCNHLSLKDKGRKVTLFGWVDTVRDHGGLLFIHLRDISGIIQIVFDPEFDKKTYTLAHSLRSEFVIEIEGTIIERIDENKNKKIDTGEIEVQAASLIILNKAKTPPFLICDRDLVDLDTGKPCSVVDEDIRLKYRYLDLRRSEMKNNIIKRHNIVKTMRNFLDEKDFIEIETPFLSKSTPEGARDYLVPSRVHENLFYALPQSPQLFKQLLMVSGFDRYYQVVKCFRDEDLRPNRQPEFTQLDLEASFIDEKFIYELLENLMVRLFKLEGIELQMPFPQIDYETAMNKYGSDKPDLRFGLELTEVTAVFQATNYKIFRMIIDQGGVIKGINLKGQAEALTKNLLQNEFALKIIPQFGGKGMSWMKVIDGKLESNIVQFFSEEEQKNLMQKMKAEDGDVLIFIADRKLQKVNEILGRFRLFIAERQNMIDKGKYVCCWVNDFPLFEKKQGRLTSVHHPFTQPKEDILKITDEEKLLKIKAVSYDLVINGEEIGGGSIRNHSIEVQEKVFELLGIAKEEIENKFGFFIHALKYGTPPHGGLALGVDRLVSIILQTDSIRDVIAFPKNRMAVCPMSKAPSAVEQKQLDELNLRYMQNLE